MTSDARLSLLREAVQFHRSQAKISKLLGYSATTISQVLNNRYPGDLEKLLTRVEEVFGTRQISCPLLGEILLSRCVMERRMPFSTANPLRVKLYRTCMKCRFNDDLKNV